MKVLIVSPIECFPDYYGNSARIASFIRFFQKEGIDFWYLHLPNRSYNPQNMVDELGDRYLYYAYKPRRQVINRLRLRGLYSLVSFKKNRHVKVDDFIESKDIYRYQKALQHCQPDVVLINYTYLSKLLNYTPPHILKIIDTHDSLHLRFKSLYNGKKAINRFRITIEDEINALNRADKVICIQEEEHSFFEVQGCKAKLHTIGHYLPFQPTHYSEERNKLLYLGAAYEANEDAISYFLEYIWPLVLQRHPNYILYIAGGIGKQFLTSGKQYPGIEILGFVDDLCELYEKIDVAINPVRMGSGMKIKNIEALSFGKPVITTEIGAEGLKQFAERGMLVVNDPDTWLKAIEKLMVDSAYYRGISEKIKKAVLEYNSVNEKNMRQLLAK